MSGDQHRAPENTREFLALWNDAVEEHLVHQLAQSLPGLDPGKAAPSSAQVPALARHVVRALRLAALSGDAAAAVRYLADAAQPGDDATKATAQAKDSG
jgi:hypothetical protein